MRRTVGAGVAAALLALVACSGDDTPDVAVTVNTPAPTTTSPPDGVLRIGLLLPQTGPGASLGASLIAGAQLAADQINAADGVNGRGLMILIRDEGATSATAAGSLDELIENRVDAVVGPASSRIALEILGRAVSARLAVCSPTNTAIGLTSFPDDGLYFRTIPSDALQAVAMAAAIERTGAVSAAVLAPDDDFGEQFADRLSRALIARGLTVSGFWRYDSVNDDLGEIAAIAAGSGAENFALVGTGDGGAAMLGALRNAEVDGEAILVNDAMRSPSVIAALGDTASSQLAGVRGTAPLSASGSEQFEARLAAASPGVADNYAAYAYDCVNLIALAAAAADSDVPARFTQQLTGISTSGDLCDSYVECVGGLEAGRNINLFGASGELDLDNAGDVLTSEYRTFTFDGRSNPIDDGRIAVP